MSAIKERTVVLEDKGAPEIGLLRSRSRYPVPELGDLCVCCDAPGDSPFDFDPGNSDQQTGKIRVPACTSCTNHVRRSRIVDGLLTTLMGVGFAMALICCFVSWKAALGGAFVFGVGLGIYQFRKQCARASAARGHHNGFDIWVGAGYCSIGTTNPRVVDELVSRHGKAARVA